eukprot:scaffold91670_cov50-Prasinocladus_malaysianus.AAC.1
MPKSPRFPSAIALGVDQAEAPQLARDGGNSRVIAGSATFVRDNTDYENDRQSADEAYRRDIEAQLT